MKGKLLVILSVLLMASMSAHATDFNIHGFRLGDNVREVKAALEKKGYHFKVMPDSGRLMHMSDRQSELGSQRQYTLYSKTPDGPVFAISVEFWFATIRRTDEIHAALRELYGPLDNGPLRISNGTTIGDAFEIGCWGNCRYVTLVVNSKTLSKVRFIEPDCAACPDKTQLSTQLWVEGDRVLRLDLFLADDRFDRDEIRAARALERRALRQYLSRN